MKYFCCQPDSHNAFVSLTSGTLVYFSVDCPRDETSATPPAAPSACKRQGGYHHHHHPYYCPPGGGAHNGGASASASSPFPESAAGPSSLSGAATGQQEAKVHVQHVVVLPECFHTQSLCFSVANQTLFGAAFAFVGASNGLLALIVVADRSVVFASGKDPDTRRDAERRQRYHPFTHGGGRSSRSGGRDCLPSEIPNEASSGGGAGRSRPGKDRGPSPGHHRHKCGDTEDGTSDASTGEGADSGTAGSSSASSSGGAENPFQAGVGMLRDPLLNASRASLSAGGSDGSSSSAGGAGGASGGGTRDASSTGGGGGGSRPARRHRSAAKAETPSTITWMRDRPLVLVGYTSGRVQWYQVRVSPAKQQQLLDLSLEVPYGATAVPAGALMHHISNAANVAGARVTTVFGGGTGDGVTVELLTECVLPDSGALVSSDFFPANGYVVVGGERSIAVFSVDQLEAPICRLADFGCSFLYCHPFLPLVGTLSWGWNTIGPCYHHHTHHHHHHHHRGGPGGSGHGAYAAKSKRRGRGRRWGDARVKGGASGVFVGNPSGYGGGCLLNILELEEDPNRNGFKFAAANTDTGRRGHMDSSHSAASPKGGEEGSSSGGGGPESGADASGGAGSADDRAVAAADGGVAGDPSAALSPLRFRHVQQHLIESHSPRYATYFSFSWKFSYELELGVCNVEEGFVSIVRFCRRTAPLISAAAAGVATGSPGGGDVAANFPYQFVHEHRLRLPLHSLMNVEYVSAATSSLASSALPTATKGGRGAEGPSAAGNDTSRGRDGSAGEAAAEATRVRYSHAAGEQSDSAVHAAHAAAPHRFAALFREQEMLAHSAMRMAVVADPAQDAKWQSSHREEALSLRGRRSATAFSRTQRGVAQGQRPSYSVNSLGAAALAAGGGSGVGTLMSLSAMKNWGPGAYHHVPTAGSAGPASGLALKENLLAATLLQPMTSGCGGVERKKASASSSSGGGGGGGATRRHSSKGLRKSHPPAATSKLNCPPSAGNGNVLSRCVEEAQDLRSMLRVGPGPTSSLVGVNANGEVASVPVEMEAIATWHEEGSVFVGLGATVCAADIVTLQGIERQMKRRMECGFRLSAKDNVRALAMVARRSMRRRPYLGEGGNTTAATSDLATVFSYVATLMDVGLIGPIGDVPSVCELLITLRERGDKDVVMRAEAALSAAHAKLPQAVRDLCQRQQSSPDGQGSGDGGASVPSVRGADALRSTARLLLLHVLRWLPPDIEVSSGRILSSKQPARDHHHHDDDDDDDSDGSDGVEAAVELSEGTSTEQDVERAVAVQVLHSRFAAAAAILRRFGYRNASYHAMASLIASHDDTLHAIQESDPHVRETFLGSLSPWLLAVFLYLCADGEDTQGHRDRIYGDVYLPLWDRVAMALLLEADTERLLRVVHRTLLRDCTQAQALMLVHGISAATYPVMQEMVDGTSDFQLAACLYARIGVMSPKYRSLFPSASSSSLATATRCGGGGGGGGGGRHEAAVTRPGNAAGNGRGTQEEGAPTNKAPRRGAPAATGIPAISLLHSVPLRGPSSSSPSQGPPPPRSCPFVASPSKAAMGLQDTARLASSQLPPPPPPPPILAAAANPTGTQRPSSLSASTADAAPAFSPPLPTATDEGVAGALPLFFRSRCPLGGGFPDNALLLLVSGEEDRGASDVEDCPWMWWVAGYRAFLDSEQAFVERTMFDVACQRLREEGDAILAKAAALAESAAGSASAAASRSSVPPAGHVWGGSTSLLNGHVGDAGALGPRTVVRDGVRSPWQRPAWLPRGSAASLVFSVGPASPTKWGSEAALDQPCSPIVRRDSMPEAPSTTEAAAAASPHLDAAPSSSPLITPEQYRMILGALSNRMPRCSICLEPVRVHQRESAQSLAWCTACWHGGHADHMQRWFSQHRICPVEGCNCRCDEDASLY